MEFKGKTWRELEEEKRARKATVQSSERSNLGRLALFLFLSALFFVGLIILAVALNHAGM